MRLTQGLLKIWIEGDNESAVEWAFEVLAQAEIEKPSLEALLPLCRYFLTVTSLKPAAFRAKMQQKTADKKNAESLMTLADQLVQEGLERGLEEGLEKGLEKGRREGALIGSVQTLQRLLGRAADSMEVLALASREELEEMLKTLEAELARRVL